MHKHDESSRYQKSDANDTVSSKAQVNGGDTHASGTLKDVNLNPVSSFFALGIPRGILPVPAFDFVVPEVASLEYFSICFLIARFCYSARSPLEADTREFGRKEMI